MKLKYTGNMKHITTTYGLGLSAETERYLSDADPVNIYLAQDGTYSIRGILDVDDIPADQLDTTLLEFFQETEADDDDDDDYILTHTPRQIAQENSLEDIERWSRNVADEFSDVDGIFGSEVTPYDLADDIVDIRDCVNTIKDWYSDRPVYERPSPRDLKYAYHIFSALSIKLAEEDE